jgi:hypothetical protein
MKKLFKKEKIADCAFSLRHPEGALDWNWPDSKKRKWTMSERDSGASMGPGPWHNAGTELNEEAYLVLLEHFGLEGRKDAFPMEKGSYMSPAELAKAGSKDPESYTLGDRRRASEVD